MQNGLAEVALCTNHGGLAQPIAKGLTPGSEFDSDLGSRQDQLIFDTVAASLHLSIVLHHALVKHGLYFASDAVGA